MCVIFNFFFYQILTALNQLKVKIIYRCYKLVFAKRDSPCFKLVKGPGRLNELDSWIQLATHTSLSPTRRGFAPGFVNYTKGTLDLQPQAYQLLAHGRWFSPGTPASPTTKTCRHDIAEILLKVALSTINQFKSNLQQTYRGLKLRFNFLRQLHVTCFCFTTCNLSYRITIVFLVGFINMYSHDSGNIFIQYLKVYVYFSSFSVVSLKALASNNIIIGHASFCYPFW